MRRTKCAICGVALLTRQVKFFSDDNANVFNVVRYSRLRSLVGGVAAGILWEGMRHLLVWYFSSLSFVSVVYGSLATAIIALISLEVGGMILLFGAQIIAEYERFGNNNTHPEPITSGI